MTAIWGLDNQLDLKHFFPDGRWTACKQRTSKTTKKRRRLVRVPRLNHNPNSPDTCPECKKLFEQGYNAQDMAYADAQFHKARKVPERHSASI